MSLTPESTPRWPRWRPKWMRRPTEDDDRRRVERRTHDKRSRVVDRAWLGVVTALWIWAFLSLGNQQDQTKNLIDRVARQQRSQDADRIEGTKQRCEVVYLNLQTLQIAHAEKLLQPYLRNYHDCKRLLKSLSPQALRELEAEETRP